MSPDPSAPAVLDVPRLVDMCEHEARACRTRANACRNSEGEPAESLACAAKCESDALAWDALAAALPALVEAGALLDRTQEWLDEHPLFAVILDAPTQEEANLPYLAVGFRADTDEMFSARGGHSLREALAALLPAAPALREEASRE